MVKDSHSTAYYSGKNSLYRLLPSAHLAAITNLVSKSLSSRNELSASDKRCHLNPSSQYHHFTPLSERDGLKERKFAKTIVFTICCQ